MTTERTQDGLRADRGQPINEQEFVSGQPLAPLPENPLVTVLVASYNQGDFIEETILSVLNQEYERVELIVVDGASTDNTHEVLRRYEKDPRLRWLSEPDDGPNFAWNKGLRLAKGDLIGLQASSDTYGLVAVRAAVQEFAEDPMLAMVGGSVKVIDAQGLPSRIKWAHPVDKVDLSLDDVLSFTNYPPMQSSFFRRGLALAIGGLDEELQSCHSIFFLDYMLEASRSGGLVRLLPDPWGNYREHPNKRSSLPEIKGIPYAMERKQACRRAVKRHGDQLGADRVRLLHRSGYLRELSNRVNHGRQVLRAAPALLAYIWYGGRLQEVKELRAPLIRNVITGKRLRRGLAVSVSAARKVLRTR